LSQIATAMRAAGYVPTEERLRAIAVEVLGVHGHNNEAARHALYARVLSQADLLCELFAPFRDQALGRYLRWTEEELQREAVKQQPNAHSGGQKMRDSHVVVAAAVRPQERSGGPRGVESPPSLAASLLAKANARREAQRHVGEVLRVSRLDTFRINNRPLAELSVGAARGWALGRGREARWILLMTANMPTDFIVGKQVTPDEAEEYWRRARDDANE
jgi:hypothetical protein